MNADPLTSFIYALDTVCLSNLSIYRILSQKEERENNASFVHEMEQLNISLHS